MPCLIKIGEKDRAGNPVVLPYDPNLAQDPRFKYSEHLPAEHVRSIKLAAKREREQAAAVVRENARLLKEAEERNAKARAALEASLEVPEPGEGEEDAQREIEERTKPFVISKANKEELVRFAKSEYGATLNRKDSLKDLRAEVARLAGLEEAA